MPPSPMEFSHRVQNETDGIGHASSGFVRGDGHPFVRHGILSFTALDQIWRKLEPLGQLVSNALAVRNLLEKLTDRFEISPGQLDSAEVLLGHKAAIITLHHP